MLAKLLLLEVDDQGLVRQLKRQTDPFQSSPAGSAGTRLKPGYCLTALAAGKLQKAQEDQDAAYQKAAKGAGTRLVPTVASTQWKTSLKAPGRCQSTAEGAW